MKCVIGLLFFSVCALQMISAVPVHRNGMVFYQSQPDYYNAHRAFVMQYASQPAPRQAYRRNGQAAAAGVTAYASGKKIATGTYIKNAALEEEDEQPVNDQLDGAVQSVAEAYPAPEDDDIEQTEEEEEATFIANRPVANDEPTFVASRPVASDVPEDVPEYTPTHFVPNNNKKTQVQVQHDEEDEEEDVAPVRSSHRGSQGSSYFPVHFGSTNGGAIAIANSYSTGKGGSASSRATAYGSAAKPKRRTAQQ